MNHSYWILLIYLSFFIEFMFFAIPSEGSTKALLKNSSATRSTGLIFVFVLNIAFYCIPLFIATYHLINGNAFFLDISVVSVTIIVSSRFLTIYAASLLKNRSSHQLITRSVFSRSRNPLSMGIHLTLYGLLLQTGILWLWLFYPLYLLNFHYKIKVEEKFLSMKYGKLYQEYIERTPRYL